MPISLYALPIHRHHIASLGNRGAKLRPIVHHALALLEQVATAVGGLNLVADSCHFAQATFKKIKTNPMSETAHIVPNKMPLALQQF